MRWLLILVLAAFLASPASAFIRLGWGDSWNEFPNRDACEAESQPNELVCSFIPVSGTTAIHRFEATLDFCTAPVPLPMFWGPPGGCLAPLIYPTLDFSNGPTKYNQYWNEHAQLSYTYETQFNGNPVRARWVITVEMPAEHAPPVEPDTEYYAFKLVIDATNADCHGCNTPGCFMLNGISIDGPQGDQRFYSYSYSWIPWIENYGTCPFIVRTRASSFGAVKAQFD